MGAPMKTESLRITDVMDVDLGFDLMPAVDAICQANSGPRSLLRRLPPAKAHPSRPVVIELVEDLRSVLFPGYFGISELTEESMRFHVGARLDRALRALREQLRRAICFACPQAEPRNCQECRDRANDILRGLVERLPEVRRQLGTDVAAAYEGDPAATSQDEALFCYPGLLAITNHRLAHELHRLGTPFIPRMISEYAHSITGIDIHPGARIGDSFFIDHGTGVVVGETCVIGRRVRIYQGVTLGAKSFPCDEAGQPIKGIDRHPIVEDDVIIYAGATILGRITIGRGAEIGGNVWLTRDVAPGVRVSQVQPRREVFTGGAGI